MADRETIIETDSGGGNGLAVIAGILLIVVIVGGMFLINTNGAGSKTFDIDVPKVTIGVTPDGQ